MKTPLTFCLPAVVFLAVLLLNVRGRDKFVQRGEMTFPSCVYGWPFTSFYHNQLAAKHWLWQEDQVQPDGSWGIVLLNLGCGVLLCFATAAVIRRSQSFSVRSMLASSVVLAPVFMTGDREWGEWNLLLVPIGIGAVCLVADVIWRLRDYHARHPGPKY